MLELIAIGLTFGSTIVGYLGARRFVSERLRFVDAANNRALPIAAGLAAAAIATPVVWVLPVVGGGTAVLFGLAVGAGAASGVRSIRRADYQLKLRS